MAETTNITLNRADGWTKVASNPHAVTVKCNTLTQDEEWYLAVTAANVAPTVAGEMHRGDVSWVSGPITGYVWVRTHYSRAFAITKEE